MTLQSFVVPYTRVSPLHIPRRDLVLGRGDSLGLRVSIIESDSPSAQTLLLTGGIGGPRLTMLVAPDSEHRTSWDYGAPAIAAGAPLWTGTGEVLDTPSGTFEIAFDAATMASWPRRCVYSLTLDWCDGDAAELLIEGRLHVMRAGVPDAFLAPNLLTAASEQVQENDGDDVLA